jgi:hypothetical protein
MWPSDFGIYYSMGNLIDDNYRLYKEAFDSKGPAYLFFLKIIGFFIGVGVWQSLASLIITVLIYFLSLFFIIEKYIEDKFQKFFLIVLSITSLSYHDALSSISIFQSSMCIFSFYFLFKSLEEKKSKYFIISSILLLLSSLTRVDTSIYSLIFFVVFLMLIKKGAINLKAFLILLFSNLLIIIFFIVYYQITPLEFYQANIDHYSKFAVPSNFKTKIYILIYRMDQFLMLIKQGVLPTFLIVLGIYFYKKYYVSLKYLNNSLALFLVIIGIIFSIYSESHSYRHIHIVVTPLLFFIIYNFKMISLKKYYYVLASIAIILLSSDFYLKISKNLIVDKCYESIFSIHKNPYEIWITKKHENWFCSKSPYKNASESISEIRKLKNVDLIGPSNGWIYIFTKTKLNLSIVNSNLYSQQTYYPNKYLIIKHKELLSKEKGLLIWIEKNILSKPSKYLTEIINSFEPVEDQGMYIKYKKK